jgi:hypothetical protein
VSAAGGKLDMLFQAVAKLRIDLHKAARYRDSGDPFKAADCDKSAREGGREAINLINNMRLEGQSAKQPSVTLDPMQLRDLAALAKKHPAMTLVIVPIVAASHAVPVDVFEASPAVAMDAMIADFLSDRPAVAPAGSASIKIDIGQRGDSAYLKAESTKSFVLDDQEFICPAWIEERVRAYQRQRKCTYPDALIALVKHLTDGGQALTFGSEPTAEVDPWREAVAVVSDEMLKKFADDQSKFNEGAFYATSAIRGEASRRGATL